MQKPCLSTLAWRPSAAASASYGFDDTNPEAERQEYIDHIKEIVTWMGWQYCAVTHSSDYFDELYGFAVQLIKAGAPFCPDQHGSRQACALATHIRPSSVTLLFSCAGAAFLWLALAAWLRG